MKMPASRPVLERLLEKAVKTETCWLWTGAVANSGYGRIGISKQTFQVHRVAYEQLVGPIPPGQHIDHTCRERLCVNPAHLEPVTQAENNRRAGSHRRSTTPTCLRGHEFTPENTVWTGPGKAQRNCRICRNAGARALRRERRPDDHSRETTSD